MNQKFDGFWHRAWNDPFHFFLWLAIFSVVGIILELVVLSLLPVSLLDWVRPVAIKVVLCFSLGIVTGLVGCILSLIPPVRELLTECLLHRFSILACVFGVILFFYGEEDWRGWHAWNQFKHEWNAKGEKFELNDIAPPPVPDDQNFALTPIVASSYEAMLDKTGHEIIPRNTNVVNRLGISPGNENGSNRGWPTNGNWAKGTETDLRGWQRYYRALASKSNEFPIASQPQSPAIDVLLALSKYDSIIEELRKAAQLPYSRFPLEYDKDDPAAILLQHLAALKRCSQVLQLRAIAGLQDGQNEKALDDVKLALYLTEAIRTEPLLISQLVRITMLQITLQPVYEGLAEQKWSDTQLAELDSELARLDFLSDYKLAMHGELGFQSGIVRYLQKHPGRYRDMMAPGGGDNNGTTGSFLVDAAMTSGLVPGGWFYQNRLRCAQAMEEFYFPLVDAQQRTVAPALLRRADAAIEYERRHLTPFNVLESLMLPGLDNAVKRFVYAQESVDLARVAVALDRYRLAYGKCPESLNTLAPQFLEVIPHDIIGGQPLHYRGTTDGQFVLYSVGWNGTDDGGAVVRDTSSDKIGDVDINKGDWVWRYPAKPE
jgi:hypothetical protein